MKIIDLNNGWRSPPIGLFRASKLFPWLTDSGSLSARIQQHFQRFNLVRLNQQLARAHADEAALLGVRVSTHVLVREVILRDGDTPLIFAHTVVARDAAQSAWYALRNLGTRPLAQLLFNDKRIESGALRYRHLNTTHPLMAKIKAALPALAPQRYWARRRVFEKAGQRLIVTEVFLGAITEAKNHA
jgi:chorismate lyase